MSDMRSRKILRPNNVEVAEDILLTLVKGWPV